MTQKEIKESGQGKIFDHKVLDRFTKTTPQIAWIVYSITAIAIFIFGVYLRNWAIGITPFLLMFLGIIFWSFYEYIHHRYLNHLDEYFPNSRIAARFAYIVHGIHHEYPRDLQRLAFPPIFGLLIFTFYTSLVYILLNVNAFFFMAGYIIGYVCYSVIHVSIHKTNVPKFLKHLYRHHAIHHYKYPDKAFGVSTTFWDRVFRTMPPE